MENNDLRLGDYVEGYRFACRCRACGFAWYERPGELLERSGFHDRMRLDEVAAALRCRRERDHTRRPRAGVTVLPLRERRTHHFVGGLA